MALGSPTPATLAGQAEQKSSPETNQRQARGPPLDVLISLVSTEPFIKLQRKETSISSHLPLTRTGELLANQTGLGCGREAGTGTSLRVFRVPKARHGHGWVPEACQPSWEDTVTGLSPPSAEPLTTAGSS